jgi:hypothetical protein
VKNARFNVPFTRQQFVGQLQRVCLLSAYLSQCFAELALTLGKRSCKRFQRFGGLHGAGVLYYQFRGISTCHIAWQQFVNAVLGQPSGFRELK